MKIQSNTLKAHYHKIGGNTGQKDEYTYVKQDAFIMIPAYKTNLQKTHNSNFAVIKN